VLYCNGYHEGRSVEMKALRYLREMIQSNKQVEMERWEGWENGYSLTIFIRLALRLDNCYSRQHDGFPKCQWVCMGA
jgi:hypothetical protein